MKDRLYISNKLFNTTSIIHNEQICIWNGKDYVPLTTSEKEKLEAAFKYFLKTEAINVLREQRDYLLAEEDWRSVRAFTQGVELEPEWKVYLQELRDLPAKSKPELDERGNLTNVNWPIKPE